MFHAHIDYGFRHVLTVAKSPLKLHQVCPSLVRMHQLGSQLTVFVKVWYWGLLVCLEVSNFVKTGQ